jgi:hypothetical protein
VAALLLQVLFSQWGPMNTFFGTAPLSLQQWLACSLAILLMIPVAHVANRLDPLVAAAAGGAQLNADRL